MKTSLVVLLAVLVSSSLSFAQDNAPSVKDWSVFSGRTVGDGNMALAPEVGYPGVGSSFLYGVHERVDLGGRFTFNYGTEVTVNVAPALAFQGLVKVRLLDTGLVSLGLQFEPGIGFFFDTGGGMVVHLPLEVLMGIHPHKLVTILLGFEFRPQVLIFFAGASVFAMPILIANPGVEFKVTENVALTFRTGFGPGIISAQATGVGFSLRLMMGVAIKL